MIKDMEAAALEVHLDLLRSSFKRLSELTDNELSKVLNSSVTYLEYDCYYKIVSAFITTIDARDIECKIAIKRLKNDTQHSDSRD